MRQIRVALGAGAALCVLVGGVRAQPAISFLPGVPTLVTNSPRLLTIADVNNDGIDDAVVGSASSQRVTVLEGSLAGEFTSVLTFSTFGSLRGIAVGDINGDKCPDIMTTHFASSQISYSFGNRTSAGACAGTFGNPSAQKINGRPGGVVLANFSSTSVVDAVTVNRSANEVTCLQNRTGNRGFDVRGSAGVGRGPIRILTADFNGDGHADVVTVNSRTRPVRDISVLFGKGNCGFLQPPDDYVVGPMASDATVTDFNNDGLPDLLVLNSGRTTRRGDFSVSVLQNRSQVTGGKVVSTGRFDILPAVRVQCPLGRHGVLGRCRPVAIAAGDFNGDGFSDLAIAFRGTTYGLHSGGFVQYYAGGGNGSFEERGRVTVPGQPVALGTGKFNGDALADLVVTESITRTVRLLLATTALDVQ